LERAAPIPVQRALSRQDEDRMTKMVGALLSMAGISFPKYRSPAEQKARELANS
jgi:hypothetical protein